MVPSAPVAVNPEVFMEGVLAILIASVVLVAVIPAAILMYVVIRLTIL